MKSKNILLAVVFVLLINIALAVDLRPNIQVTFDEIVNESTINVNLTNQSGALFALEPVSSANPIFVYRPMNNLAEGLYTVRAQARDMQGILGPVIQLSFPIIIPPLEIEIIEPRFGITSVSSINLTIQTSTDRNAVCNYSFTGFNNMYNFDSTDGYLHRKVGLSIGATTSLYIRCLDQFGKISQKTDQLILDVSNPTISADADDVTELPLETTLEVNANEEVICKFDNESTVFADMTGFDDYDEDDESAYKINPTQALDAQYLTDGRINRFHVRCMDKSGRLSNLADVSFNVATSQTTMVTIHYPSGALPDDILRFNASTNKNANYCQYSNESGRGYTTFSGAGKTHVSGDLSILDDGSYTYYVRCWFSNASATWYADKSTNFVIDSTPPSMLYLNMTYPLANYTGKTYKDDELCAKWEAGDNESGISQYAYYIFWDKTTDELIDSGTESPDSDNEYCIDHLSLNNSQKYYIKVQAKNAIGLWSSNLTSSSIEVDTSLTPAGCNNDKKDGSETDIDCGGNCASCANGKSCRLDSDCISRFCNASNKCAEPKCNDGIKNGAETDVDCGGNCNKKCDIDDHCNEDKDCKTNNCDAGTKKCAPVLNTCENGELDPSETDVDCGGSCPGCGVGRNCDSDTDCINTAECKDGVCTFKQTDSDGDGLKDDEDNCADVFNTDQADVDGDGIGDACDPDSDNDGLPDSFEQQYFDCITCANPEDDPDKDGLTNLDEYRYNTNPVKADTDGDGYNDKDEIDNGTDPLDPSSHPRGGFLKYLLIGLGLIVLGVGGYFGYGMLKQKKKPFVPPLAPRRTLPPRMPIRRPVHMPVRRQIRPLIKPIKPPIVGPAKQEIPKKTPEIKEEKEPGKIVQLEKLKEKKKEDIFAKLSDISKAERKDQVEKNINALKLTDRELKERIDKLRKELNLKQTIKK